LLSRIGEKRRGLLEKRRTTQEAKSLKDAEKHRGCLEPPSRIGGSFKEANGIEDVQIAIEDS
jgi:hypothetical protein